MRSIVDTEDMISIGTATLFLVLIIFAAIVWGRVISEQADFMHDCVVKQDKSEARCVELLRWRHGY